MNETIKMVHHDPKADQGQRTVFNQETAAVANKYHESFPGYQPTPLAALRNLAASLGITGMYVKDESFRFGLNAFKGLGGSYCLGKYIAGKLGEDISQVDFDKITSPQTRDQVGEITFVTATDGNHGR